MRLKELVASEKGRLWGIFILAVLLRWLYALPLPADKLSPDAFDWMNLGEGIATGLGLGNSWRPPGYAAFLAAEFLVFGKSVLAGRLINGLLGGFTCMLAYHTARRLFSSRVGLIAALLYSFYPYSIAYSGDMLSEPFLTFMLAAGTYLVVKASDEPTLRNMAAAGVCIGLAGLTKSVVLPFFLFACAWLWWRTGKLKVAVITGLFTLLAIAPWTVRNYFHYDKTYVMPVSTPWFTFYGSSCDEAFWQELNGEMETPTPDRISAMSIPKDWGYVSTLPLPERDKYCKEKALAWVKANPDKFTSLLFLRLKHFWRLYPMMAWPWQKYAAMATSGLYIPLAFAGFVLGWREYRKTALLAGLFVLYTGVYIFFSVTLRYRTPIDPQVIIMAAFALDYAYRKYLERKAAGSA